MHIVGKIAERAFLLAVINTLDHADGDVLDRNALHDKGTFALETTTDQNQLTWEVLRTDIQPNLLRRSRDHGPAGLDAELVRRGAFDMIGQMKIIILRMGGSSHQKQAGG